MLVGLATGCEHIDAADNGDQSHNYAGNTTGMDDDGPAAAGILSLLNHPRTTVATLDFDAELDVRAARALIWHRNGVDGAYGTQDDDFFESLAEVDAVSYVGDAAIERLLSYAQSTGWVPSDADLFGIYHGVAVTNDDARQILDLVNTAVRRRLDDEVGLDSRAVESIMNARPINSFDELMSLDFLGGSALISLEDYVDRFGGRSLDDSDGSFVFTEAHVAYYLDQLMQTLRDDDALFEEWMDLVNNDQEVDLMYDWVEDEIEIALRSRIGRLYTTEEALFEEMYTELARLEREAELLIYN